MTDSQDAGVKVRYALYMPLGGFMRGALTQEKFIQELVSRGILMPPTDTAPSSDPVDPPSPVSPNFG
ncbi:hypothetical protein [Magnetospirillum fulvum]|uniref:Uncharacterized protein n=1 Tax=Magnetospirillum fulvum MGU-K5 TaxID=1316936 RepID=S9S4A2_MAGFU|nr:hypothetical protein [Magnetospirillum fulvum]EPY00767.1 hypothetical protein K678_14367 [Magnetospirillum fulvum MGU-K5]